MKPMATQGCKGADALPNLALVLDHRGVLSSVIEVPSNFLKMFSSLLSKEKTKMKLTYFDAR